MKLSRAILQQAPDPHSTRSQNLSRTSTAEASLPPQETSANTQPLLFPENEDPAAITSLTNRRVRRIHSAEVIRIAREDKQQSLAYTAQPFALCNLPARPLKDKSIYERKNGKYFLRIEAGQGRELPFGQDRLVLILLATAAVLQRSRSVKLGSAADILKQFGLSPAGRNYQRLIGSFDRLFSATIYWGLREERYIDQRRISMLDHVRLWYQDIAHSQGAYFENQVTLSQPFFDHILEHPIPVDMQVVRCLMDSPAELDFYIWIVLRTWTTPAGATVQIPLLGPEGLREQLGTQVKDPYKFRQMVKKWLSHTKVFWPECPVQFTSDSDCLVLQHGEAIRRIQEASKPLRPGVDKSKSG